MPFLRNGNSWPDVISYPLPALALSYGSRTRSVFERYAIVSQSDIRDAMTKLEAGQQRDNAEAAQEQNAAQKQCGQGLGKIEPMSADSHNNSLPTIQQVN